MKAIPIQSAIGRTLGRVVDGRLWSVVLAIVVLAATSGGAANAAEEVEEVEEASKAVRGPTTFAILGLDRLLAEADGVHPDVLAGAPIVSSRVVELAEELSFNHHVRDAGEAERARARGEQMRLVSELWVIRSNIADWRFIEAKREADEEFAFDRLVDFSIGSFVSDEELLVIEDALSESMSPIPVLLEVAREGLESDLAGARSELADARSIIADLQGDESDLVTLDRQEKRAEAEATESRDSAQSEIDRLTPMLESAIVLAPVDGVGFPVVVLDAYYRAQLGIAETYPACELAWYQLAGIGRVESVHGTYRAASVKPDGAVEPHILGVVLDGTEFSAIADTDGGGMDGNAEWDRAVGPMQFIPSSWGIYGRDGNGDGRSDPHNLYDAALAAGEHLCRSHAGLQQDASFRSALLGYNRSEVYGSHVMGYASDYAKTVTLIPVLAMTDETEEQETTG